MKIYSVKINGYENPIGYHLEKPVCSWKIKDAKGAKPIFSKIEISLSESYDKIVFSAEGNLNSLGTVLDFDLKPYTRYYVKITVTSKENEVAVSNGNFFETGKLNESWKANFVGTKDSSFHPRFKKDFSLTKEIKSARIYICGLGLFEAYINGEKVGKDVLAPFINDYKENVQYCTYDITSLLKRENTIDVYLGNGWYRGRYGLSGKSNYDLPFSLIAELRITYEDMSVETICTDNSWKYTESIFKLTDIYDGEIQDYTVNSEKWENAVEINPNVTLCDRYSLPLEVMEKLPVKEVIKTPENETVLDFGQNFSGLFSFVCNIPKGKEIKLQFGEILQNGCFYNENYRTAKSEFTYISDGKRRIVTPHFTFFGYRYIKVICDCEIDFNEFYGLPVHSKMDRTGYLKTGNEKINRLHENALWGLKSNFIDIPTDCPQRDERLGWCGDANVFTNTASFLMDTRAFYSKFLRDLRSDQIRNNGKVAIYFPNEFPGLCAAVWSDIGTFLPDAMFRYYGNIETLEKSYPLMLDWVNSIRNEDKKRGEKYLWDFGFQFGDWLALDGATEQSIFGRTDSYFVSSIYYYASVKKTLHAATVLDKAEKSELSELCENIKNAILNEYFTPNGRLAIDTQTAYLLALDFDICPKRELLINALKNRIKKDCRKIKGGFVGATMMNTVLGDNGMTDLAYDFLFYEGFPGWLYAVNLGATTIWERWNSVLPDGKISGTGMNSLNHYSYGSVVEFLYRHCAGLKEAEEGFKKAIIEPKPDIRLETLDCSFDSASGEYKVYWEIKKDGSLYFNVTIPFGTTAVIKLPEKEETEVGSGIYEFSYKPNKNYRRLYNDETSVETLLKDLRAEKILLKYLPNEIKEINKNDIEAMSKSLSDMKRRVLLFRGDTSQFDRAIDEISLIEKE